MLGMEGRVYKDGKRIKTFKSPYTPLYYVCKRIEKKGEPLDSFRITLAFFPNKRKRVLFKFLKPVKSRFGEIGFEEDRNAHVDDEEYSYLRSIS
jgi:hypothetical protein